MNGIVERERGFDFMGVATEMGTDKKAKNGETGVRREWGRSEVEYVL